MATIKQMHIMRIKAEEAKRSLSKKKKAPLTPLAKEVEMRKEEIIRGLLGQSVNLVNQQLAVASLPVTPEGKDNDTVLKATNSLLDRVFGKSKESVELSGTVQFSLRELAKKSELLEVEVRDVEIIE